MLFATTLSDKLGVPATPGSNNHMCHHTQQVRLLMISISRKAVSSDMVQCGNESTMLPGAAGDVRELMRTEREGFEKSERLYGGV